MSTRGRKTILVTGATDGLGKQVVRDLASGEVALPLHGRSREKGKTTLREIEEATSPHGLIRIRKNSRAPVKIG
jgi:short-subunit dehydrogenase